MKYKGKAFSVSILIITSIALFAMAAVYGLDRKFAPKFAPPLFTDYYIISPGIAGGGIPITDYPLAADFIERSGCLRQDRYFGSAEMNCVLEKIGVHERVAPNTESRPALEKLELLLRSHHAKMR